ncbi:MAG: hypothetical protein NZ518_08730, partial [Dehalococcoidia bacterium]|nr:hypothetical protein [Dehalococcoidia bacterium]
GVTVPLHGLVVRGRPEDLGLPPDGAPRREPDAFGDRRATTTIPNVSASEAARDGAFWWLVLAFSGSAFAVAAMNLHLIPYWLEQGMDSGVAATAAGALGALSVVGRVVLLPIWERASSRVVTAVSIGMQATALAVLLAPISAVSVAVFVALFGMARGAMSPARATLLGDLYGRTSYATISGLLAAGVTAAQVVAPVGVGVWHGVVGDYTSVIAVMAVTSTLAAGAVLLAKPRARPSRSPVTPRA